MKHQDQVRLMVGKERFKRFGYWKSSRWQIADGQELTDDCEGPKHKTFSQEELTSATYSVNVLACIWTVMLQVDGISSTSKFFL